VGGRNDFLGTRYGGRSLTSFGINPGGYVGFFDPLLGKSGKDDQVALEERGAKRLAVKRGFKTGRGSLRKSRNQ
jgi:hypothetical protein